MRFPVWRELKQPRRKPRRRLLLLTWDALSRSEGIETCFTYFKLSTACPTWNALSRSEGIETVDRFRYSCRDDRLEMRFPVRRELKRLIDVDIVVEMTDLKCAFPFGGNWNPFLVKFIDLNAVLEMPFPVRRELKLDAIFLRIFALAVSWNALSRSEGIETNWWTPNTTAPYILKCRFPFGGNWNSKACMAVLGEIKPPFSWTWNAVSRSEGIETIAIRNVHKPHKILEMPCPVRRELKPVRNAADCLKKNALEMPFPVRRELKRKPTLLLVKSYRPWNALSRSEGIETLSDGLSHRYESYLEMPFPVRRELKLDSDTIDQFAFVHLKCAFPFGGNWTHSLRVSLSVPLAQCPYLTTSLPRLLRYPKRKGSRTLGAETSVFSRKGRNTVPPILSFRYIDRTTGGELGDEPPIIGVSRLLMDDDGCPVDTDVKNEVCPRSEKIWHADAFVVL